MANKDLRLIENIKHFIKENLQIYLNEIYISDEQKIQSIEHPLDNDVLIALNSFDIRDDDDDYRIFNYVENIKNIWNLIIEKSIKCLRYFDKREPFIENSSKHPVAYGVKELNEYFIKYTEFESMLYGGSKNYRDHVVHVFRTWLLGLDSLLENNGEYLEKIIIEKGIMINSLEKISIWSITSLTHDLGYPLEKAQEIIEKTKGMMKSFVSNPILMMDLSFNGVQINMNDFVVRFMSSKMHEVNNQCPKDVVENDPRKFVARLQPKYYFKFQKSLENCNHGILSSIIIYKLLIYFLESDFSINEDYQFNEEDARQFYIRREILRSIASHTCHDIYHLNMLSFAFLLIVVDEVQEWGRKRISELYIKPKSTYEFGGINLKFVEKTIEINNEKIEIHRIILNEQFKLQKGEIENLRGILRSLLSQSESYKEIFRDGQDTAKRNFNFVKHCEVIYEDSKPVTFLVELRISNDEKSSFDISVKSSNNKIIKEYSSKFFENLYSEKISVSEAVIINEGEMKYSISNKMNV